jgi:hypothetical protein
MIYSGAGFSLRKPEAQAEGCATVDLLLDPRQFLQQAPVLKAFLVGGQQGR